MTVRPEPSDVYAHPRALVAEAVEVFGPHTVIETCMTLAEGFDDYDLLSVPLTYLGGAGARSQLDRGDLALREQDYWPRVWGLRGLLYVWMPYAAPAVAGALADRHWRVREMAAKVIIKHDVGDAVDALIGALDDGTPRVQVAAIRAAGQVGGEDHLERIEALDPDDRSVALACAAAVRVLRRRLDRP